MYEYNKDGTLMASQEIVRIRDRELHEKFINWLKLNKLDYYAWYDEIITFSLPWGTCRNFEKYTENELDNKRIVEECDTWMSYKGIEWVK